MKGPVRLVEAGTLPTVKLEMSWAMGTVRGLARLGVMSQLVRIASRLAG